MEFDMGFHKVSNIIKEYIYMCIIYMCIYLLLVGMYNRDTYRAICYSWSWWPIYFEDLPKINGDAFQFPNCEKKSGGEWLGQVLIYMSICVWVNYNISPTWFGDDFPY